MRIPRGLVVLLVFAITLPALYTLVHGEVDVKENAAATPDKELRSNEKVGSKTDDEVIQREEEAINPDGFSVKEMKQLRELGQSHQFQAEVNKMMNIIINSLYSNKDVFLRELISNASDALDKIRFLSLTDAKQLDSNPKLEIRIKADKENGLLHITDGGIGMTKEELLNNLGTIAKSGTTEFLEKFKETAAGDTSLIGQFGVGFYSVFLVADTVTVTSKHNDDKQYAWISDAQGTFSIVEDPRGNTLGRGTQISIAVKEDATEYLEEDRLKQLVKKYSEFINFPIYLHTIVEEDKTVDLSEDELAEQQKKRDEEKAKKAAEKAEEEENEEVKLDEEEEEEALEEEEAPLPTTKTTKVKVAKWELMNETKPLWVRNPKDVTDEEYNAFYKAMAKNDVNDPAHHIHFSAEGEVDFKALLYIPGSRPSNPYDPKTQEDLARGIKLYVRRVFITDEFKDLLPRYLNFVKGIVDSDDLPLNVSREMLQEHKTLKIIKKKLIRKAIAMIQEMADAEEEEEKEKFSKFWTNFGDSVKLGLIEDPNNRLRLSKLLMFHSSKTNELTTLTDYVERMKKNQEQIYYLGGENLESVQNSPLIEKLVKKGYEVLFMVDPIDEYSLQHLDKFDGKYKLSNIGREGVKFDSKDSKIKEAERESKFNKLTSYLKEKLAGKIDKAVVSTRLTTSPAAMVAGGMGWTANMHRLVKAQTMTDSNTHSMYAPRKTLEINPNHPIIVELQNKIEANEEDPVALDVANLLYDTAALTSGFTLDDQADFASRIVKLLNKNLDLDPNAVATEDAEDAEEEEVEEKAANEEEEEEAEEVVLDNKDEL